MALPLRLPSHLSNLMWKKLQAGLLFFISVFWAFLPLFTAIFTFPQERAMLVKERSVNMYKLSAYFIARITTDLFLDLVLPVTFLVIVYFMVRLKLTFNAFSLTLLTILLSIIAAQVRSYDSFLSIINNQTLKLGLSWQVNTHSPLSMHI